MSTGWPQAAGLPTPMKITPVDWLPAVMLESWQLAPLSVGWHDQPSPLPPPGPPWPWPIIQVPAGRVIEAVTSADAAVPVLLTVNTTWAPQPRCVPYTLMLAASTTAALGAGVGVGVGVGVGRRVGGGVGLVPGDDGVELGASGVGAGVGPAGPPPAC